MSEAAKPNIRGINDRIYWKQKDGTVSRIDSLESSHLQHILWFLEKRSEILFLHSVREMLQELETKEGDWADDVATGLAEMSSLEWLRETPLYTAIKQELRNRELSGVGKP